MVFFEAELNIWVFLPFYIGIYRILSYILLKVIPSLLYKPYQINDKNTYSNEFNKDDITMIVPLYQTDEGFEDCLKSWINNKPYKIILVVDHSSYNEINTLVQTINWNNVIIHVVDQRAPGKRQALYDGYLLTETKLILFGDDDAIYCDNFLDNLILPFNVLEKNGNNLGIGGVSCKQVSRPKFNKDWNFWDIMMDMRLYQRMIELRATSYVDKSAACLSGRTELYRKCIFDDFENFEDYFLKETFYGKLQLSGDDKCMTRICMQSGFKLYHQISEKSCLSTKFEDGKVLIKQILRWSRNTIRSDFKSLFIERFVWRRFPFLTIIMIDRFIAPVSMIAGVILIIFGTVSTKNMFILTAGFAYIFLFRLIKLLPYFLFIENRRPLKWLIYVPCFIIFQYVGALLLLYASFTLGNRKWGNRQIEVNKNNEIIRDNNLEYSDNDSDEEQKNEVNFVLYDSNSSEEYSRNEIYV